MLMRYLPPYAAHDAPFDPGHILLGRTGFGTMSRSWVFGSTADDSHRSFFTSPRREASLLNLLGNWSFLAFFLFQGANRGPASH